MCVHDGIDIGAARNSSVWMWDSLGTAVSAVELAATVEVDFTDIVGDGEQEPAVLGPAATQQDPVGIRAER